MMMRYETMAKAAALSCASLLAGCTSMTVTPVASDVDPPLGLRYHLPKPVIHIVPRSDTGGVDVEILNLPDESREYAINVESIFAAHRMEIDRSRGMLSRVDWQGDSSSIAGTAVIAAGEASKKQIIARETAKKTKQAAIKTAAVAVQDAEKELEVSRRKLAEYESRTDDDAKGQVLTERLNIIDKEETLKLAQKKLEDAKNAPLSIELASLDLNIDGKDAGSTGELTTATPADDSVLPLTKEIDGGRFKRELQGGMMFSVEERQTADKVPTVVLRRMTFGVKGEGQIGFASVTGPKPNLRVVPSGRSTVLLSADGKMDLPLTFNKDVDDLKSVTVESSPDGGPPVNKKVSASFTAPRTLVLDLRGFIPGEYRLRITGLVLIDPDSKTKPYEEEKTEIEVEVISLSKTDEPSLTPGGVQVAKADDKGQRRLTYTITGDPLTPALTETKREGNTVANPPVHFDEKNQFTIDTADQLSGNYELTFSYKYKDPTGNKQGTWKVAYTIPKPPTRGVPELSPSGILSARPNENQEISLELMASRAPAKLLVDKIVLVKTDGTKMKAPPTTIHSDLALRVNLFGLEPGQYHLDVPFKYKDDEGNDKDGNWPIDFEIFPPAKMP